MYVRLRSAPAFIRIHIKLYGVSARCGIHALSCGEFLSAPYLSPFMFMVSGSVYSHA